MIFGSFPDSSFCSNSNDYSSQARHSAVMELRRRNAISLAAGGKASGPCLLRNKEKDHDDHF
jgi:hypothetical protein